ncbi:flagellar motor protein MotD [Massilia sp. YIM B02443]|uniref:flagellar motor protein MotD n=1 Tax=Massilia sp. YIM B02443 TaxID=3050127 RepID=UPI0025B72D10|nr:flagellar motor protein MotD [Massilia sp. YIM B02443]MDN4035733.1 flagellar motor protein MotD [Massilia sp. YIM B02443]
MARKRYDDDVPSEHHERWLISYADFITLLFAFFVVMYAISIVNEGKYQQLSEALGDAFGGRGAATQVNTNVEPVLPLSHIVNRKRNEAARREHERMGVLARDLTATLLPLVKSGQVRVTQNARGVSVEINASVLFDQGQALLQPEASEILQAVGGLLRNDPHRIEVEGHTDDVPIASTVYPSNWELSAARASSVVRLFIDSGVAPARLSALGFAATRPVAANTDPVGQARNRRVAVMILAALPETGGNILP